MPSLIASSEDTRIYECCVLYPYPLPQKEEAVLLKEVEGLFAEAGAKLVSKDAWGRRGLAYPIKGFNEGSYVVYYYEMDPSKLKDIDQQLKIMKNLMRHLIVKPPKHYQVVKYSETYETWLKERESVGDRRTREQAEKVQERVAEKAKRQAKQMEQDKKTLRQASASASGLRADGQDDKKGALDEDVLTEQIDKLISDDTLDI